MWNDERVSAVEPGIALVAGVLDLESHHCRWPVGTGFCGCAKIAGSYCRTHYDRGYTTRRDAIAPAQTNFGPRRVRFT